MNLETDNKKRLLIIEDDSSNLCFLISYLKRYFEIETGVSADDFYDRMKASSFDIIMMDISIRGEKNGLDLTKEIKADPKLNSIPVICYTAHTLNTDRTNAIRAGCDLFIKKPTDNKTLLQSLFNCLGINNTSSHNSNSA